MTCCRVNKPISAAGVALSRHFFGLKPIPQNNMELPKLINDPKDPISSAKVELGKNFILSQGSPGAVLSAVSPVTILVSAVLMAYLRLSVINGLPIRII
jgi:hypothetical protein